MRIRSTATLVLAVVVVLLGGVTTSAGAAESPKVVPAPDAAVQAWECPVGHFCAWTGLDGTGSRCAWLDADKDWRSTPDVCSWSGSTRVQSYLNNGRSTSYTGATVYTGANYVGRFHCALQGGQGWNVTAGGVFLRSHRWTTGFCN